MFKDKEYRKSILRSLVASSIFLIFLKPIFQFLWIILVNVSTHTYTYFIDTLYKNAALGQRNWIDFITLTFFLIVFTTTLITSSYLIHYKIKLQKIKEEIRNTTDEGKLNQLKTLLAKKLNIGKSFIFLTFFQKFNFLFSILLIFSAFVIIFTAYSDMQLNTSFNQRINVVAPYINDHEYKLLKSEWASMVSRKDFEIINNKIEIIARENKIEIPKNLLK
jgi:hypothetical protein